MPAAPPAVTLSSYTFCNPTKIVCQKMFVDSMIENKAHVRLAATGDLLLTATSDGGCRDADSLFAPICAAWNDCDIVVGNLECTLTGDGQTVDSEPRVVATEAQIRAVAAAGFTVVSLANNHMFDCLEGGFRRLTALLDGLNIAWFGAGNNLAEASEPAVVRRKKISVAFVGGADRRSGTPFFATDTGFGVRPLDDERLPEQIAALAHEHDHVVVCPHWGEERLRIPAPEQIALAHRWIDAGASLVLGHHPHVIQGIEHYGDRVIAYSLGNFAASPVPFSDGQVMNWTRCERTGCLLRVELEPAALVSFETLPVLDDGHVIRLDTTRFGRRRIAGTSDLLAHPVTLKRYRREYFRVKTLLPILNHLGPSQLIRLRPRHVVNALRRIRQGRRAD